MRNKETKKEYDKLYNLLNKDRKKKQSKQFYLDNKDKILEQQKQYRLKNKNKIKEGRMGSYIKYEKKYYIKNKDKIISKSRERILLKKYNLTPTMLSKMIENQNNKCSICNRNFTGVSPLIPCVDHNHVTNKVRGVLCLNCNTALGSFNDDIINLNNAISYLKYYD